MNTINFFKLLINYERERERERVCVCKREIERITNPIFKELLELKIVSKKNIARLSATTRDKKISVYKDLKSGVIFLEKYITDTKYYEEVKCKDDIRKTIEKSKRDDKRRFFQFKKILKNKKILDFGCEWGGFLKRITEAKSLTGIELRKECIAYIKKRIKKIEVTNNINNLNNKYDIITLFHVLEHIPYQIETLKKIKKQLSKNGKIIIEVPSAQDFLLSFSAFKKFTFWSEHLILHTEKSLRTILKKSGFRKIQIKYYQRYNFYNHIGWFIKKIPGGHNFYKHITDKKINKKYLNFLLKKKITDTFIATAYN
jgi:2-polyprenyl-3-methyl-5-hydroxy-6-metoxy-1,4-benzoquinol methylase